MTTATAGSVFFKLAQERGRYREIVGETLDAEDPQMRETLATVFRRSCVEQDADVEVRGRLYNAPVFVLSERPELCFLEADRDGVPIGARDTKTGWHDRSALPYLRELAERWSRAESPTHAPGLPLASAFIPPRLRLLTSEQTSQQQPESGWIHWEDLPGHARIVLIGEPGAGKSTCLRRLVHEANLRSDKQVDTLPIYLQLREFTAADLTVEHLRRLLTPQLDPTAPDEFNPPQNGGRILLLLDGLDEIASNDERRALLENIRGLCAQAPSIRIIVTTREHSYDGELAEFTHLRIEPLTLDRISHWYLLSTGTAPTDTGRARVFAALLRDANLRDLFRNPLMLTVVTAADARNWVTNGEKAPLLRRCVDMLTENWDATRGVTRWDTGTVTPRQMKTSLADLSCALILQNRADFTIGDFERLVASNVGIHDSPAELLDACHATGLITAQDRGTYRFTHQALREYLAASRVADHVSVATPLLRACPTDPHAQNVWSLSCAATTDASDLLGTALRLEGPQRLERAAILASALGQQITASRDVINQCSDYIATQLEAELANARIVLVGTEGTSEEDQGHAGPDKAVLWRAALHLPTESNDAEPDGVLEHLLVAVHNTRSGSGAELVKNRLERSGAPAVRLLATLQTIEGECTVRVQRNTHALLISFIVLDPTKLLASELNAARTAAYAPLGDPHAFSDDRGSSSLDTTDDPFSELHETLVTRLGLRAAPIQRPSPMPKDTPAPSPMAVQVGSGVHANLSHNHIEGERASGRTNLTRFRILGPLEVLSPEGWTAISAVKWRSLLACLLVRPGQLVPTDSLIDELWGDNPPTTANNLVSIYAHRLRKVIGDSAGRVLVHRAPGYMLQVSPGDLDSQQFEALLAEGRTALGVGDVQRAAALLAEALGLWRGPLLADVPRSPLIGTQADRAAELWLAATELRIEADLACGRTAQAVAELRGLVAEHPMRERLWLLLMRALEDAGRRAEALEAFAQAQGVIAAELGVDPGAELQRFHQALLAADPPTAAPPSPQPTREARAGRNDERDAGPHITAVPGSGPRAAGGSGAAADYRTDAEALSAPDAAASVPGTAGVGPSLGDLSVATTIGTFAQPSSAEAALQADLAVSAPVPLKVHPAQLPADIGDFTGRDAQVEHLCALFAGNAAGSPGAVRIAVVNGMAGLGKTTLAVHAAHQVSGQFPDGQLYVDLLGASLLAARPGEVLARFLRDLGIEGDKVPARDHERAALYRTTLTGRRVLILLDNAKDAAQVRPLLPGSSSCAVLVTTRNRTSDLASMRLVDPDVLEDTEALALFSRIVGEERAAAEPDATAEVLVACAGLPLAIRICAARLAARRQWKIATLADRLLDQHRRLDELRIGDLAVRASFQVNYDSLRTVGQGADPARAFRMLGLWQGASISLQAAAALLGEPDDDVAEMLESLVDVNLLESPALDWYRFHDLLKVYAMERAEAEEAETVREEAVERLLWWYLETAQAAADTVSPQRYQVRYGLRASAHPPLEFTSTEAALAWFDDERANIVAATRQAAAVGLHEVAYRLPPTLFPLFNRRSNWADCVTAHRVAAESASKTGDQLGEAWALNQLGFALARLRDPEAFTHLERALAIRREFGDPVGEAQTALALGEAHLNMHGHGGDALRYMHLAVDLLRPADAPSLRAVALNNLGEVYLELGDLIAAEACYIEARDICHEIGSHAEGHVLHNLGSVYQRQHRYDEATATYAEALLRHRTTGLLFGEALTLKRLGEVCAETGDTTEARSALTAALRIFEQIGEQEEAVQTAAMIESLMTGHRHLQTTARSLNLLAG